jgi:hypothetical protein
VRASTRPHPSHASERRCHRCSFRARRCEEPDSCVEHVHVHIQLGEAKRAAELVAKGRCGADRLAPGVAHAASGSTSRHCRRRTGAERAAIAHPAPARAASALHSHHHRLQTPSSHPITSAHRDAGSCERGARLTPRLQHLQPCRSSSSAPPRWPTRRSSPATTGERGVRSAHAGALLTLCRSYLTSNVVAVRVCRMCASRTC